MVFSMSKQMSMSDFYENIFPSNPPIVDVREAPEFNSGHIPGSINIPIRDIVTHLERIDTEQTYYFVAHTDHRSQVVTAFLASQEFDVVELVGGIKAWPGQLEQ